MTSTEIERQLTTILHQHAEEAMTQTDTTTELNTFHARVDQDARGPRRRRGLVAAAAVSAAVIGIGAAVWVDADRADSPGPATSPPSSSPPSSPSASVEPEPEAPQTPGSVVRGFDGLENFPMRFIVPRGFVEASEGGGTRGYTIRGTTAAAGAFVVNALAGTRAANLPPDLAEHVRDARDDLVVSNVRATEVGGREAQAFTLTQEPGTASSDLWCARAGSCYKLLEEKPMDMTFVRTANGLVLFEVEYLPRDRTKVQTPAQDWLDSVRWE